MRRALLSALLLAVALGCGAREPDGQGSAAAGSQDATTSRVELTIMEGKKRVWRATGVFDYEHDSGFVEGTGGSFEPMGPLEFRFIGRSMYMSWMLIGKKRWTKDTYEPTDAGELLVPIPDGPDPDGVLDLLLSSSRKTEIKGNDEIRGVSAKHYRVQLDIEKLRAQAKRGRDLDSSQDSNVVVDVWIDADDLVRRITLPDPDSGSTTFDFYDFGVEVEALAPPEETISEAELNKLIEAECKVQAKKGSVNEDICAYYGEAEGSGGDMPVETVTQP